MMNQIHIWQMVIDVCLVAAILLFSFRWVKGSRAQSMVPRTLELESSLRSLIQEADGAGRHLNEQLLQREQSLQRTLADIEAAEQKLMRAVSVSEERESKLEISGHKASALTEELRTALQEFKEQLRGEVTAKAPARQAPQTPRVDAQTGVDSQSRPAQRTPTRNRAPEPEPPLFEEISDEQTIELREPRERASRSERVVEERRTPAPSPTSSSPASPAYGAAMAGSFTNTVVGAKPPLRAPTTPAHQTTREIEANIPAQRSRPMVAEERALEAPRARAGTYANNTAGHQALQQVYATAETLLKQGQRLEQVSAQTRLPVEEIQLLSQMIEIERNEASELRNNDESGGKERKQSGADPRLGALGGIRRQNATL